MLKKPIIILGVFFLLFQSASALTNSKTIADIQAQINQLTKQIAELQSQLLPIQQFDSNLFFGLKNDSRVANLQNFLTSKGYLAPDLNTGNFFAKTREAVLKYQKANDLPITGYVGPLTRAKINNEIKTAGQPIAAESQQITPPLVALTTPSAAISETQALPETASSYKIMPKPDYDLTLLSKDIQDAVNKKRSEAGLGALSWDDNLAEIAKLHSIDQARDNIELIDPAKPCAHPFIRHEGFMFGFTLSDRLKYYKIDFKSAGENITMYPIAANLIYRYSSDAPPINCYNLPLLHHSSTSSVFEITNAIQSEINKRGEIMRSLPIVVWVNKEWLTREQIAEEAVKNWMESESHKKNILTPEFIKGGVGIAMIDEYIVATHVMTQE